MKRRILSLTLALLFLLGLVPMTTLGAEDSYTVTFNAFEGSCNETSRTISMGSPLGTLPTPTWSGHLFYGWYAVKPDVPEGDDGWFEWVTEYSVLNYDAEIRAHWIESAVLTFDPNGGTCDTDSLEVELNAPAGILPTPKREDYTFTGWFTEANGGTEVHSGTEIQGDMVLYAHWVQHRVLIYTYNAGNGSDYPTLDYTRYPTDDPIVEVNEYNPETKVGYWIEYYMNDGTYTEGGGMTLAGQEKGALPFVGWSPNANGGEPIYQPGDTLDASGIPYLFAQWGPVPINPPPTPTREGYVFDGWYTEKEGGQRLENTTNQFYPFSDDELIKVFYAHWTREENYHVTVRPSENGSVSADPQTAGKGDTVTLSIHPDRGYSLYSLTAMTDDADPTIVASGALGRADDITFQMPDSDVTVTAEFKPWGYTVGYSDPDNGTLRLNTLTAGYGETVAVTLIPDPGYTFYELTVTDSSGDLIPTNGQGGSYTFLMPDSDVSVRASFQTGGNGGDSGNHSGGDSERPRSIFPFTDVPAGEWYYKDVKTAYESYLIDGKTDTIFAPNENLTFAQAVKLAACMHQRDATGSVDLRNGDPWYQPYVDYCWSNGIIDRNYSWDAFATRAQYMEIFASALPDEDLAPINAIPDNAIPDVKMDHPQAAAIYKLYRAGVVQGSDKGELEHVCAHADNIRRSEVSAILTRMMHKEERIRFEITNSSSNMDDPSLSPLSLNLTLRKKFDGGGADNQHYIEESLYGTPWFGDVDGDGSNEFIYASRSVFCLDPDTGGTKWRMGAGTDRNGNGPGFIGVSAVDPLVLDIDGDGRKEIITGHSRYEDSAESCCVAVYDSNGNFKPGWPKFMNFSVRALKVSDLDRDGQHEIIVGLRSGPAGSNENGVGADGLYVFEPDGSYRPGWPKNCDYGLCANTVTTTDMDGDGTLEIVLTYDGEHPRAYHADGTPVTATGGIYSGMPWTYLSLAEDYRHESNLMDFARSHNGIVWGNDDPVLGPERDERYLYMGSHGGVAAADVDGNGSTELIFTGMIVDGKYLMKNILPYSEVAKYCTLFILNTDRTRYVNPSRGYDWTQCPMDPAPLISVDQSFILYADMTPEVVDLDGDGAKEILYAANDGHLHCWNLNRQEPGNWPFLLSTPSSITKEFATQPACVDLNGDGKMEVIFATYTQEGPSGKPGTLFILDCSGKVLAQETLPGNYSEASYEKGDNGSVARPCVGDFDGDGRYEIALNTLYSGLTVYDIDFVG